MLTEPRTTTKAGYATRQALEDGCRMSYRTKQALNGLVALQSSRRTPGIYLVELHVPGAVMPETHSTRRIQRAREVFREFCQLLDVRCPSLIPRRLVVEPSSVGGGQ